MASKPTTFILKYILSEVKTFLQSSKLFIGHLHLRLCEQFKLNMHNTELFTFPQVCSLSFILYLHLCHFLPSYLNSHTILHNIFSFNIVFLKIVYYIHETAKVTLIPIMDKFWNLRAIIQQIYSGKKKD